MPFCSMQVMLLIPLVIAASLVTFARGEATPRSLIARDVRKPPGLQHPPPSPPRVFQITNVSAGTLAGTAIVRFVNVSVAVVVASQLTQRCLSKTKSKAHQCANAWINCVLATAS